MIEGKGKRWSVINRRTQLEKYIQDQNIKGEEADRLRGDLDIEETLYLRNKRKKMKATDFNSLKVIGRGAFGEVHRHPFA